MTRRPFVAGAAIKMQAAGGELVKHYRDLAFMGFTEVLMNLRTIFRNLAFAKKTSVTTNPTHLY